MFLTLVIPSVAFRKVLHMDLFLFILLRSCVTNEGLSSILENSWPIYSVIPTPFYSSQPFRVYWPFLIYPPFIFSIFHILFWVVFWVTPLSNCIQCTVSLDVFYNGYFFFMSKIFNQYFFISTFLKWMNILWILFFIFQES